MQIVEENLHSKQADKEVPDYGGERGELVATGHAPPTDKRVHRQLEYQTGYQGVNNSAPHGLLVDRPVHLVRQCMIRVDKSHTARKLNQDILSLHGIPIEV